MDLEEIRRIFQRDKTAIIKRYEASGAGIGKVGEEYVIMVYKNTPVDEGHRSYWENIPLYLKYTGTIRLQNSL